MQLRVFKSLCTYRNSDKYFIPHAICTPKSISCLELRFWCLLGVARELRRNWFKSVCFINGDTSSGGCAGCNTTPNKFIIFSCFIFFMRRASDTKEVIISKSVVGFIIFIATVVILNGLSLSKLFAFPRWTRPYAPGKKKVGCFWIPKSFITQQYSTQGRGYKKQSCTKEGNFSLLFIKRVRYYLFQLDDCLL